MTTVFLLGGAFSNLEINNYMTSALGGAITNGNTAIIVPYNTNGLFLNTVQQGAAMLNSYLLAGTGQMVAFGHSLGAVVCNYWLNAYAPTTTISPSALSFVWIGNSVSVYGGALGPETNAWLKNWFGTGVTAPSGTSFKCVSIARQYDGWADWPTGTMNFDAEMNAFAGQQSIHTNYQNVNPSPAAPGNVSYIAGNITYIWSMTEPVPLLGTTWGNPVIEALDAGLRPTIESAYSRPVNIQSPSDMVIMPPVLAVTAVLRAPAIVSPNFGIAVSHMTVTASMPVPVIGWALPAPVMAATAVLRAPVLAQFFGVVAPVAAVTASMPAPVMRWALTAPVMAATAVIPAPAIKIGVKPKPTIISVAVTRAATR